MRWLSGFGLLGREDLVNPPLDDPGVILARIDGVQREFEALLALDAAVAIGGVAAALGEDSADVSGEAEGRRFLRSLDADAGPGHLLSHFGFQVAFPVRSRRDPPRLVERCEPRVGKGEMALAGNIAFQAVGKRPQDHEPLPRRMPCKVIRSGTMRTDTGEAACPLRPAIHRHDRGRFGVQQTARDDRKGRNAPRRRRRTEVIGLHDCRPLDARYRLVGRVLRGSRHFFTTITGISATRKGEPDFSPRTASPRREGPAA